ncbi:MAG TPA: sigma-70 family RNA polymerase sigma factor [Gaiellaceae bacterium]
MTPRQGESVLDAQAQLERLYREHGRDVYRLALRDLGNREDAEDATQAAFLNAYRALVRGDLPRKPRSWLLAIAENVCRRRFRSRSAPTLWPLDEERLEAPSREEPLLDEIVTSLGGLSDTQRSVLVLRELGDFSYEEISQRVGLSVQAVQMQLFRARRRFRQELSVRRAPLVVSWLPRLLDLLRGSQAASTAAPLVAATVAAGVFVAAPAPTPDAARSPVVVPALQAPPHHRSAPAAHRRATPRPAHRVSASLRAPAAPAPARPRAVPARTAPSAAIDQVPAPPRLPTLRAPTPPALETLPAPPAVPAGPTLPVAPAPPKLPAPPKPPAQPKLPALPKLPAQPKPPPAPKLPTVSTSKPTVPPPPVTGLPAPSP